jgi:hypothetical protein
VKKSKTPTFLVELPLRVDAGQAKRLHAHFEAARCLLNALLGEAMKRLRAMRADAAWQEARAIPQTQKQERKAAFSHLRQAYGFSEYALHEFVKEANCTWISDHIDSMLAQTLATRAYRAANRVCLGKAKKVRFRSKGQTRRVTATTRNSSWKGNLTRRRNTLWELTWSGLTWVPPPSPLCHARGRHNCCRSAKNSNPTRAPNGGSNTS